MKIFKRALLASVLTGFIYLCFYVHFQWNYVYYYQHSAYTDKTGIPFVALDHLSNDIADGDYKEEGDYVYKVNGLAVISYHDSQNKHTYYFTQTNGLDDSYELVHDVGEHRTYFDFSSDFKLIAISQDFEDVPITKEDESFAYAAIDKMTEPLLSKVQEPMFNFQWLFDLIFVK